MRHLKIRRYLIPVVLSIGFNISAQEKITYQQACEDIDYYFDTIDSIHPNMYWYTPKSRVDSFIRALKIGLTDSVEVNRLGYELQLSNCFWDYHTNIHFYLKGNIQVFPMTHLRSDGLFLGDKKIISVNGIEVRDLYPVLEKMKGCDVPMRTFYEEINQDPVISLALYGLGLKAPFQVIFDGEEKVTTIEGVLYQDLSYDNIWKKKAYSFQIYPEDSLAIIYFDRCTSRLDELDHFLTQTFDNIQKAGIKDLFIDVSRNPGGTTDAAELFLKYIHFNRTLRQEHWVEWKEGRRKKKRCFRFYFPPEQKETFKGRLFIYQSYATRSAGPWLGEILKAVSRAIIIGTPTEATLPAYVDAVVARLPHSRFRFQVSKKFFYKERILIPRTEWGGVLPEIEYPFLTDRRLDVRDCKKIIEWYENK